MTYTTPREGDRVQEKVTKEEGVVTKSLDWDSDVEVQFDGTEISIPVDRSLLNVVQAAS